MLFLLLKLLVLFCSPSSKAATKMPGLPCWTCGNPASINIFKTEDMEYQQGVPYGKLFCFRCYETHNHDDLPHDLDDFHDLPSDQDDPPDAPPEAHKVKYHEMHHEVVDLDSQFESQSEEEVDDCASIGSSWQIADDAISLRSWHIEDDCSSTKSFNLSYQNVEDDARSDASSSHSFMML